MLSYGLTLQAVFTNEIILLVPIYVVLITRGQKTDVDYGQSFQIRECVVVYMDDTRGGVATPEIDVL